MPGTRHGNQSASYPRQIQQLSRQPIQTGQTYEDRMGFGSNSSKFRVPDAHFPECGFVCDLIQSQTPTICLPSSGQQSLSGRCSFHELESTSCICVSSIYSDSCCSRQDSPTSVQNSSNSSVLATTTVVLRTSPALSVSLFPRLLTQFKGRFIHQNLPVLDLHAWELSNNLI